MANIADGTYVILAATSSTGMALDCEHGSEMSGANIRIHTRNDSDAQLVHITTIGGHRKMTFPQSGKSLDVDNAVYADGTNVQQYDDNDSTAQRWEIVSDGLTATIDGVTYDTYNIVCAGDGNFCMDVYHALAEQDTNIQIHHHNTDSNAERFCFVPMNPVPTGTYIIHSALDYNAVLDVSGGSTSSGANIQLYGKNGTNAQVFIVKNYSSSGLAMIANAKSNMFLNVAGNIAADGTNVQQYTDDGTDANRWIIEPYGHITIDGLVRDTYRFDFLTSHGYVMDAAGGSTTPQTNVQIYLYNDTLAQNWYMEPYSLLVNDLPTPADILVNGQTQITYTKTLYPSWICDGTEYQCRYRTRQRSVGKSINDWGAWQSIYDGSTANEGWGDVGIANCTTADTQRKTSAYGAECPTVDNTTYDYAEVEFEVRRFDSNYNETEGLYAHGNSVSQIIGIALAPTLTVSEIWWSVAGLTVNYTSSYKVGGNTIVVEEAYIGDKKLCGAHYFSGQPYTGTVTVPIDELYFVPDEGDTVKATIKITTANFSSAEASISGTVQYESNYGVTISPTYITNREDYTISATVTKHDTDKCYLKIKTPNGYVYRECDELSTTDTERTFRIAPPLNTQFTVCWVATSGTNWGTMNDTLDSVECKWYVWTWENDCCILGYNKDDAPDASDTLTADSTEIVTTGREYPVEKFGKSVKRDLSITGVYIDNLIKYSDDDAFERLHAAHTAVFRTPRGKWYKVAVTSVDKPRQSRKVYGDITVTQKAVTL